MFAGCHLKLRDTEKYDVSHGLRIPSTSGMPPHESPEPPKRGANGVQTGYIALNQASSVRPWESAESMYLDP
ncbi:hypothetical protein N7516_009639 [Penicillium verrucosum]|uniref:uncharacterized protein n=1 Tax=Penicillium verrucosum TaxID=60171 RepID=UPI00254550F3|nr:uncharacterized protein N7516_009639 [Penicillium verrucosum]KAJ5921936.1 hypothetical protein N7516_009639 [Penicillium verrucosum]